MVIYLFIYLIGFYSFVFCSERGGGRRGICCVRVSNMEGSSINNL